MFFIDLAARLITFPNDTFSTIQYEKREGPSMFLTTAPLPETFFQHVGASRSICIDGDFISDGPGVAIFLIVNLEFDRSLLALCSDALKSSPSAGVTCLFYTRL